MPRPPIARGTHRRCHRFPDVWFHDHQSITNGCYARPEFRSVVPHIARGSCGIHRNGSVPAALDHHPRTETSQQPHRAMRDESGQRARPCQEWQGGASSSPPPTLRITSRNHRKIVRNAGENTLIPPFSPRNGQYFVDVRTLLSAHCPRPTGEGVPRRREI